MKSRPGGSPSGALYHGLFDVGHVQFPGPAHADRCAVLGRECIPDAGSDSAQARLRGPEGKPSRTGDLSCCEGRQGPGIPREQCVFPSLQSAIPRERGPRASSCPGKSGHSSGTRRSDARPRVHDVRLMPDHGRQALHGVHAVRPRAQLGHTGAGTWPEACRHPNKVLLCPGHV